MKEEYPQQDHNSQVAWNLSSSLIMEVSELLVKADQEYLQGKPDNAYYSMKAIKMRIVNSLNAEERKYLKAMESKVVRWVSIANMYASKYKYKEASQARAVLAEKYEEYNETIMDLLDKYGYLIQRKEDKTKIN